jgi:1-acyl-sn-glycerol-3-phosphate acyltransferase
MHVSRDELAVMPSQVNCSVLRRGYCVVAYGLFWFVLGSTFLTCCLCAALLYPFMQRERGQALGRRSISRVFAFVLRLAEQLTLAKFDASALDALELEQRLILAPNHPSLLDVALVISRLSNVSCIMKAELWDNIFLGAGARLAHYIRNDTIDSMVRMAADDVAAGSLLLMFPEGTRTVTQPVNAFKGGLALIAKRAQAPVQTIFIETNTRFLCKGWPLYRLPESFPVVYRVRLGKRFEVPQHIEPYKEQLQQYFERELTQQA